MPSGDAAPRLILGSASPRRAALLAQIGVVPHAVRASDIDETPRNGELAQHYCMRLARAKAAAVPAAPDTIVIAGDTAVASGRRVLGKPADAPAAERMLRTLSGRRHRVTTAVAVRRGAWKRERRVTTLVRVKRLSEVEIGAYVRSGEWAGKAGAYAIQGAGAAFVPWINGSFSAVVGLPLAETAGLLGAAGYPVSTGAA